MIREMGHEPVGRRLRLGIPVIADAGWMGGVQLIVHVVGALSRLPPDEKPHLTLVFRANQLRSVALHAQLFSLVDEVVIVGLQGEAPTLPKLRVVASLEALFQHIDFFFPAHVIALPGKPAGSWIPDFQHHRLPEMFSAEERALRDHTFQAVAANADLLVLSSHAAHRDWEYFYPNARPIVRVLPFRAVQESSWFNLDPAAVAAKHGIGEPFLMCSNQFWIHKGYTTLVDAVGQMARLGARPLVVCTGSTEDYRSAGFLDELRARMAAAGVADRFRVLGLLPRAEQMALMRRSLAVLQASLFEGWSTVVEDARLLGKSIVLSDIDVHLEQSPPRAHYFQAGDPEDLARVLMAVLPSLVTGPILEHERQAREEAEGLLLTYARGVCALAREAATIAAPAQAAPYA